ncbi:hypothetical protein [Halarchaeum nitratireducens]|uniref:Secreted glycoprotein n=1 Tax=Halarchaeum nitratireducens TaxID=489913 RepID=A0A830GEQ3_9EURY|nr:hypothetical protein [Halarchaeum nitratireducens]GGN25210.1 hypothetical protein GCM10009021_28920 [Halarchaeum nitratireducens]
MTDTSPSIDRRSALQAFGSLTLAALAGCTSTQTSEPSSSSTTTPVGPFASLNVQGTTLVVELEGGIDIEHVNLVKPNGSLFGTRDVAQGTSRVSFDLGTTYTPGDYELVAVNDDQTIGTTTRSLRPDLQIIEMGIGRNHPKRMWSGLERSPQTQVFVTIENQGSGPTAVTQLLFFGTVPYPSGENGTQYAETDISGIYDPESDSEVEQVVVPPGGSKTIYSSRMPFAFIRGGNVVCQEQPQSGTFELALETSTSNSSVSRRYDIRYSASEEFNNCSIEVGEDS